MGLILEDISNGYRMAKVNSRGESWLSERDSRPAPASVSEQPTARNGATPALQRADRQPESGFATGVLAEGEELSSNSLRRVFNGLRTTQIAVDVDMA
jgi:hypothetical protein